MKKRTAPAKKPASPQSPLIHRHEGMCDASAVAAVGKDFFLAANDETNILYLYRAQQDGPPVKSWDLSAFLDTDREADIEASAQIGRWVYWITSHGTNAKGKGRKRRSYLFATTMERDGDEVEVAPIWTPCRGLYAALTDADSPAHKALRLDKLDGAPPKEGGLSIEGLAQGPNRSLLIGLRSPLVKGRAAVVPLENPLESLCGEKIRLAQPHLLDLGGLGIRSLEQLSEDRYFILAGPPDQRREFRLFDWQLGSDPVPRTEFALGDGAATEGLICHGDTGELQVFLDEGTREKAGVACKDAQQKSFRSMWLGRVS